MFGQKRHLAAKKDDIFMALKMHYIHCLINYQVVDKEQKLITQLSLGDPHFNMLRKVLFCSDFNSIQHLFNNSIQSMTVVLGKDF